MRYINYSNLNTLICIYKLAMEDVKVHIFSPVFSIKIKKKEGVQKVLDQ